MRLLAVLIVLSMCSVVNAQSAIVLFQNDGKAVVVVFGTDGTINAFSDVTVIGGAPEDPATNPYPEPSALLKTQTRALASLSLSRADATAIAKVYGDSANRVPGITTAQLKQSIISTGKLLGLRDAKYNDLVLPIDNALKATMGIDDRQTTDADKQALRAVAWSIWEAGK